MPRNILLLHLKQTFHPQLEFSLKVNVMGLNPGYLLQSFLLYLLTYLKRFGFYEFFNLQEVLNQDEKNRADHQTKVEQELKQDNPLLSRVGSWLHRQKRSAVFWHNFRLKYNSPLSFDGKIIIMALTAEKS